MSDSEISLVQDWVEQVNHVGPAANLEELEYFINSAPVDACETLEYVYLLGMYDMLLNLQELGGIKS